MRKIALFSGIVLIGLLVVGASRTTWKLIDASTTTRIVGESLTVPFASTGTDGNVTLSLPLTSGDGQLTFQNSQWEMSADGGSTWSEIAAVATPAPVASLTDGTAQLALQDSRWRASYDSGSTWQPLGGGGVYGVEASTHTITMLTKTGTWTGSLEGDLQVSARINRAEIGTAETLFSVYETYYGCHVLKFGMDASDHLVWTYATALNTCTTSTVTSTATVAADQWLEVAMALNAATDTVVFYVNGVPETGIAAENVLDLTAQDVEYRLYEGFQGIGGVLKVSTVLTWPTASYKGIDTAGAFTAGGLILLPLSEGGGATATDLAQAWAFTKHANAAWVTMPGLF